MESTTSPLAIEQVFATTELFEYICSYLLCNTHSLTNEEDPRSVKTHSNARKLQSFIAMSRVNRTWHHHITNSRYLQRELFLLPDATTTERAWNNTMHGRPTSGSHSRFPSLSAPLLNPIIQTTFPSYNFRFCWNDFSGYSGGGLRTIRHCAFMMITRRDVPKMVESGTLSRMLLSQPPCTHLEAKIYEERDETKEYVGRTVCLDDPVIGCEDGLTLGMVHRRVRQMFETHKDVVVIKLVTL